MSISLEPDFRHQFDANPRPDPEVEALLAGVESPKQETQAPFVPQKHEPAKPQFQWLGMKTLR